MDFLLRNQPVNILTPVEPSGASAKYIGMKDHGHLTFLITVVNDATVTTASSISLLQASDAAGIGAKPIVFTRAFRNLDSDSKDTFQEFEVTDNTFTIDATINKKVMYVVDVPTSILDKNGDFSFVSVFVGDGSELLGVVGVLTEARFSHLGLED